MSRRRPGAAGQTGVVPEGDTIHRTAARLAPALVGKAVASFDAARLVQPGPKQGVRIDDVEARGKYLLVHFDDGWTLETHMKMSGSWHIYRSGERWKRSKGAARAVIETDDGWIAVCFSAPHVKLVRRAGRGGARSGAAGQHHLGPDLCLPDPDLDEVVRRFSLRDPTDPAAVLLLDQRIFCGVGNVYKSEVLFACQTHPLTPVESIDASLGRDLAATANRMLLANLGSGPRTTTQLTGQVDGKPVGGGPILAVYSRRDQPCIRCGTPIVYGRHGVHARATYWCPSCQNQRISAPPGTVHDPL